MKAEKYTVEQLVAAGGNEWAKNEMHRVYFSVNLVLGTKYKNSAKEYNIGKTVKLFYDVKSGKFEINVKRDNYQTEQKELAEKAILAVAGKIARS